MAPIPPSANPLPRLVTYFQTHHDSSNEHTVSVLPFVTQPDIHVTHVIVAAIHLNENPQNITLNDHSPSHSRFQTLWAELRVLQASGVKVMGLLGGAAKGSYLRLDGSQEMFELFYKPLKDLINERALEGLDLDVEEEMSLAGIVRLIDRLRADFGKDFIITMAPVAAAMLDVANNLSGFDYQALEAMRGRDIAWYNTQFYCGWGDLHTTLMYDAIIARGWAPEKIVIGVVTNPSNGRGYVQWFIFAAVLTLLQARYSRFGGVMGWEYFNSLPGGTERPWEWARDMTKALRGSGVVARPLQRRKEVETRTVDAGARRATRTHVPARFEYYSDGIEDE